MQTSALRFKNDMIPGQSGPGVFVSAGELMFQRLSGDTEQLTGIGTQVGVFEQDYSNTVMGSQITAWGGVFKLPGIHRYNTGHGLITIYKNDVEQTNFVELPRELTKCRDASTQYWSKKVSIGFSFASTDSIKAVWKTRILPFTPIVYRGHVDGSGTILSGLCGNTYDRLFYNAIIWDALPPNLHMEIWRLSKKATGNNTHNGWTRNTLGKAFGLLSTVSANRFFQTHENVTAPPASPDPLVRGVLRCVLYDTATGARSYLSDVRFISGIEYYQTVDLDDAYRTLVELG